MIAPATGAEHDPEVAALAEVARGRDRLMAVFLLAGGALAVGVLFVTWPLLGRSSGWSMGRTLARLVACLTVGVPWMVAFVLVDRRRRRRLIADAARRHGVDPATLADDVATYMDGERPGR